MKQQFVRQWVSVNERQLSLKDETNEVNCTIVQLMTLTLQAVMQRGEIQKGPDKVPEFRRQR